MPSRKPKDASASAGTAAKAKTPARAATRRKPAAAPSPASAPTPAPAPASQEAPRNPALRMADRLLEAPTTLLQALKVDSWQRPAGGGSLWPLNKFEDVFDQRVAESLARMGMPSPERLRVLADALEQLLSEAQEPRRKRTK